MVLEVAVVVILASLVLPIVLLVQATQDAKPALMVTL